MKEVDGSEQDRGILNISRFFPTRAIGLRNRIFVHIVEIVILVAFTDNREVVSEYVIERPQYSSEFVNRFFRNSEVWRKVATNPITDTAGVTATYVLLVKKLFSIIWR